MKKLALTILVLSMTAFGQDCPKYQHWEYRPAHWTVCNPLPPESICIGEILAPATNLCVDDIHVVTEKEWQEVLETQLSIERELQHMQEELDAQLKVMEPQDTINQILVGDTRLESDKPLLDLGTGIVTISTGIVTISPGAPPKNEK